MANEDCLLAGFMEDIKKKDTDGVVMTPKELKENQFGMPLKHYAQQYLFGATGLRIKVFHSIAGVPASCKSPLLFDLMGHISAPKTIGGLGGIGVLFELEDKISPTLLQSVLSKYGDIMDRSFRVVKDLTLQQAMKYLTNSVIPAYKKNIPAYNIPLVIGLDSIGGSASQDVVDKIMKEGVASKGYYDKSHIMKYFCEGGGQIIGDIPMIVMCVNQEKEAAASTPYGPPQKKVTGGVSQVFKDGHMISANFKTLASGDGKIITLRTTKTSFSDSRKIEVTFRWNKFGQSEDDAYGHHFEWALASAKCLADPEKGVGDIRDICDVKVSDQNLVTCPQLGLKSVQPEEFEEALFDESNEKILNQLRVYQKIEKLKDVAGYADWLKARKGKKPEPEKPAKPVKAAKPEKKSNSKPLFPQQEEEAKDA